MSETLPRQNQKRGLYYRPLALVQVERHTISAFRGKADMIHPSGKRPLIAISGHWVTDLCAAELKDHFPEI